MSKTINDLLNEWGVEVSADTLTEEVYLSGLDVLAEADKGPTFHHVRTTTGQGTSTRDHHDYFVHHNGKTARYYQKDGKYKLHSVQKESKPPKLPRAKTKRLEKELHAAHQEHQKTHKDLFENALDESKASEDAKRLGLEHLGFNRYGKNGIVTHKSFNGMLRSIKGMERDEDQSAKERREAKHAKKAESSSELSVELKKKLDDLLEDPYGNWSDTMDPYFTYDYEEGEDMPNSAITSKKRLKSFVEKVVLADWPPVFKNEFKNEADLEAVRAHVRNNIDAVVNKIADSLRNNDELPGGTTINESRTSDLAPGKDKGKL